MLEACASWSVERPGTSREAADAASTPGMSLRPRLAARRRPRAASAAVSPPAFGRNQTPARSPLRGGHDRAGRRRFDEVADLAVAGADYKQGGAFADDGVLDAQGCDVVAGLEVVGNDDDRPGLRDLRQVGGKGSGGEGATQGAF